MTDPRAWVERHREDLLAFLQEIVERESPTEAKAAVDALGQVFQAAYRALGCAVRTVPQVQYGDHVVAETPPVPGPRVLLVGHLDTVYPLGTVARRPFTLRDGRAYGPAVMDMKGGLAVMLFALRALAATRGLGNARVVLNSDEEPGSPTSRDRWAAWSADADWAFVLEPAQPDGSLVLRRKGVGIFRLAVTGRAAHAGAEPERGANAILALAHHALAAAALADPAAGTTVNVGVVRGGTLPYVVPAAAEALIDVRVPTRTEAERVLGGLRALEAALAEAQLAIEHYWAGALRRAVIEGDVENGSLMAGQSVGMVTRIQPASAILAELVEQALRAEQVTVLTGTPVDAFATRHGRVAAILTPSGEIPADVVVIGIGVEPNSDLARDAGIALGDRNAIHVDEHCRTSVPGVWAAGDCADAFHRLLGRSVYFPLGTTANKQGRICGLNLGGRPARIKGIVGTAITRFGETEIARTGLSEREARANGFSIVVGSARSTTRSGYFPGASWMTVKMVAEEGTGRLLGAQIVGGPGAGKRIDVVAAALHAGMRVDKFMYLDLAYAPPFSPVWDPLLIAARKAAEQV